MDASSLDLFWPRNRIEAITVWKRQGLGLPFPFEAGAVQLRNGPCGFLAIVTAQSKAIQLEDELSDSPADCIRRAQEALARVLWRIATALTHDSNKASCPEAKLYLPHTSKDAVCINAETGALEGCVLHSLKSEKSVAKALGAIWTLFSPTTTSLSGLDTIIEHNASAKEFPGALLFVYSCLMTRGVEQFRVDVRDEIHFESISDQYGCTEQALLNLMLTGRAHGTISDGVWSHYCNLHNTMDVGFLVSDPMFPPAQCFRAPVKPVWVLLDGGHYTVMWSRDPAVARQHPFMHRADTASDSPVTLADTQDTSAASAAPRSTSAVRAIGECCGGCGFFGSASTQGFCSKCYKMATSPTPFLAATPADGSASQETPAVATRPLPWTFREVDCAVMHHFNGARFGATDTPYDGPLPEELPECIPEPLYRDARARCLVSSFKISMYGLWRDSAEAPAASRLDGEGSAGEGDADTAAEAQRLLAEELRVKYMLDQRVRDGSVQVLVVCEPDGRLDRESRVPDGEEKWRCRDCHLQVPTVWSAIQDASQATCRECGKHVSTCGVCHWLPIDELPKDKRRQWELEHAPPMTRMLRVRWPQVDVQYHGNPPCLWG